MKIIKALMDITLMLFDLQRPVIGFSPHLLLYIILHVFALCGVQMASETVNALVMCR